MLYSTNTGVATDRSDVSLEEGILMLIDAGFPALDFEILSAPSKVTITLPDGYTLENGAANASLAEGKYRIVRTK